MRIGDLFETPVADKIEPVIKVGETGDAHKLAGEIGSYVVTPMIEKYLDDFLEHFTDTFFQDTTEIGIWISGYFGSGKSHFAKIAALVAQNLVLDGVPACKRFEARIPSDAPHRASIVRSLGRMDQCATQVLAFNLNTLADSRTPSAGQPAALAVLPGVRLQRQPDLCPRDRSRIGQAGQTAALHAAVEARAKKPWADIQKNLTFYRTHLYAAACEVAPDVFPSLQDVDQALKEAERGELHNVALPGRHDPGRSQETGSGPQEAATHDAGPRRVWPVDRGRPGTSVATPSPGRRSSHPRARASSGSSSPPTATWVRSTRRPAPWKAT